jgi:hypothetical protein
MRSNDIISLYENVGVGAEVTIVDKPLADAVPGLPSGHTAANSTLVNR